MGSPGENRLQIKEFTGVDRNSDGTVTPQTRFYTIQNMHPNGPGELKSISGIVDNSGVPASPIPTMPGVGKILHTRFMRDAYNNPLLLAFYRPSSSLTAWIPVVVGGDFSKSGTTTDVSTVSAYVVYVGPGGYTKGKRVSLTTVSPATTLTFTVPTSTNAPPGWVAQIDIYINEGSNLVRRASLRRKANGLFPTTVTFTAAFDTPTDSSVTADPVAFYPDRIKSTHTAPGTSSKYETWYFGSAPNFLHGENKPIVGLQDSATPANFLTSEVDIINGTTISIDFAYPKPAFGSGTRLRIGDFDILRMLPFAGRTPEDLVHVGSATSSDVGRDVPIDMTVFEYTVGGISANGALYTAVTGTLISGDRVVYRTNSGSVTGLADGTKYYVRVTATRVYFYDTYVNYLNGVELAISGTSGSPKIFMQRLSFFVKEESLFNSRNNCQMISTTSVGTAPYENFSSGDRPNALPSTYSAIASRTQGIFCNHWLYLTAIGSGSFLSGDSIANLDYLSTDIYGVPPYNIEDIVGCWVFRNWPWTQADCHQLLPGVNERSLSQTAQRLLVDNNIGQLGPNAFFNPLFNDSEGDEKPSSSQFRNRVITANGDNQLWSTNGYVWKPLMRSNGKAQVPQSRYVQAFDTKLIAGGGKPAIQNADNIFYYSEAETPFDWGTSIQFFSVFSKANINGLGVYSQNLTDVGYAHFLVISKKDTLFVWDGSTSRGPQQLHYSFGFAGPKAFAVTDAGPMFVSRDNIYVMNGDKIQDLGDEISPILKDLTDTQLHRINLVYHKNILKIGYPSGAGTDPDCDAEVWFDFRTEAGELKKYVSGPHALTSFYDQDATLSFDSERAVRASCSGVKVYQRDTGDANVGASISRSLVISRLGLSDDHLKKLLTRIYLAVKITANETFAITFEAEDGTSTNLVLSEAVAVADGARHIFQKLNDSRFAGRINKVTVTTASTNPISIFDLSLFFRPQKRARLGF